MKKFYSNKISYALIILFLFFCQSQINAQWTKEVIDENLDTPTVIYPGDIDGDGDEDLVAAIWRQNEIFWYEYNNSSWIKHLVDDNLGAVGVFIVDLDRDGNNDIVVAGFSSDEVKWYKNSGGDPVEWTSYVIDNKLDGPEFTYVSDIDDDGDLDVIATGAIEDCLVWYDNRGGAANWTKHFVDQNIDGAGMVKVLDIDGDGIKDIVANGIFDGVLAWYKKEGAGNWTKYPIDTLPGLSEFDIADVGNDNDYDIVASARDIDDVVFFENMGGETVSWTKYIIDGDLAGAFGMKFADIDGDDNLDVVATANEAQQVTWYRNNGGSPDTWRKYMIGFGLEDAWDLKVIDTRGEGFPDVIVNQYVNNGGIIWYKNPLNQNVGISDIAIQSDINIYPNPTEGIINISGLTEPAEVKIYSIQGQQLKSEKQVISSMNISDLQPGMYILNLQMGDQMLVRKIIKN